MGLVIDGAGPQAAVFIKRDDERGVTLAYSNGTTNFGKMARGTSIGLVTSGGKARPCGATKVDVAQAGVTEIDVDDASNFFAGDTINITSLVGTAGTASPVVTGAGDKITIVSKANDGYAHKLIIADPSANDKLITSGSAIVAGVETVTVTVATGGAGAISSTLQQVIDEFNATSQTMRATVHTAGAGTAVIALASTPLAGGVAVGASILSAQAITAVDKTSAQHTITTAATVTVGDDDLVTLSNGAATPLGLLGEDYTSFTGQSDEDGTAVHADVWGAQVVLAGRALRAACTGLNTALEVQMPRFTFQ